MRRGWLISVVTLMVTNMCAPPSGAGDDSSLAAGLKALPVATQSDACRGRADAFLSARLRGAASLDIHWHAPALQCDGGVRPDGRGVRIIFRGHERAHRLLLIFGIDAPPRPGVTHNVATNLTVIFEGEQRVYSTGGSNRCTLDELRLQSLPAQSRTPLLGAHARGFCTEPADALGGGAALLVSRFDFSSALFLESSAPSATQRRDSAMPLNKDKGGP